MTRIDQKILFTALGFTAVVMQGNKLPKSDAALKATTFSALIEDFCRVTLPEAFEAESVSDDGSDIAQLDKLITRYKSGLQATHKLDLAQDRDLLLQVYDRLQQRHRSFATANLLADEICHHLEEEIFFDSGLAHEAPTNDEAILHKFEVQHRMADVIVTINQERGNCQPDDLKDKGFSSDEIAHHWPMASALAAVKKPKGEA